jgi:hypothetical protein
VPPKLIREAPTGVTLTGFNAVGSSLTLIRACASALVFFNCSSTLRPQNPIRNFRLQYNHTMNFQFVKTGHLELP